MKKLKLLYPYEGDKAIHNLDDCSHAADIMIRAMQLSMKSDLTKEEKEEIKQINKETETYIICTKFTKAVHKIHSLYLELKNIHENRTREKIYNQIGRLQCEIEILKEENEK